MKKVTLSVMFGILVLMLAGCGDTGNTPTTAEAPDWEYAIGDKVLHKSGVLGVVIDMDFYTPHRYDGLGRYAQSEGQWVRKKMQRYYIRLSGVNGLALVWVFAFELEDAPGG